MPLIRSTMIFAAGVALGAAGREALPKLREALGPLTKETLAPLAAAAVAGARDAMSDACTEVGRRIETVQERVAERHRPAAPTA